VYAVAREAELRAGVRGPFQIRAGRWRIGPFVHDRCNEVPLEALAEPPLAELPGLGAAVVARATIHVVPVRDHFELNVVTELGLAAPAFAVTPVHAVIVFRDGRGGVLDRLRLDLVLPADGSSVISTALFGLRMAAAATVEVLARGARTVAVPLARFALDAA
jgi:hypothetical protein